MSVLAQSLFFACSVCFGDPNSSLTQGAKAGIVFLLVIVGMVLGAIVGIALYWAHRARMLEAAQSGMESAVGAQGPAPRT